MQSMLRFHAAYRCRDSGACCTAGWPIPVEATLYRTLEAAVGARSPAFVDADLPADYARLLAMDAHGACVFHDAASKRCAIHHALGPAAKPLSCRAFPRIVVRDPRGASISLSHYCPSAADLLFGPDPIEIVDVAGLADLDAHEEIEGLDAREALPPVLREDVLVDWESLTRWERHVADVFDHARSPDAALAWLWRSCDRLRSWRRADGPLAVHVDRVAGEMAGAPSSGAPAGGRFAAAALVAAVLAAIPAPLRPEPPSAEVTGSSASPDAIRDDEARAVHRYLAARAHACWPLHQGAHGLRSQLVYLEAAHAIVRRLQTMTGDVREAIRITDLWLVHLASPQHLAAALDALLPGHQPVR